MSRITPTQVVESYRRCGMRPTRGLFYARNTDGSERCCGLVAVALANDYYGDLDEVCTSELGQFLQIPAKYARGFQIGFDNGRIEDYCLDSQYDTMKNGADDAKAAYDALVTAGLVS